MAEEHLCKQFQSLKPPFDWFDKATWPHRCKRSHCHRGAPFNGEQVRRFVDNWSLANEMVAPGNKNEIVLLS
jgi:hypothetical protein